MNSLVWKQWRESRFVFYLLVAWMILSVSYTILYELGHGYRAVVGSFSSSAMLYSVVALIVLAIRTSQGEQADGTLSYTTSLPVSIRRIALVRILGAVGALSIPILVAAMILAIALASGLVEQAGPRPMDPYDRLLERPSGSLLTSLEQLLSVTAIAILSGAQLLVLLCLFGCWLRSQAQVGLLGAVLGLGSMVASGLLWFGSRKPFFQLIYGAIVPQSLVVHWGHGESAGSYTDHELATYRWMSLGLAIPMHVILAWFFVFQYGVQRDSAKTSRLFRISLPAVFSGLPIRLPSRLIAMIWLELRQSVPLVVCGLLFAALVTVAGIAEQSWRGYDFGTLMRSDLPHTVFFTGMLWSVVVGSGLYSADLVSKLGDFWRSRPISAGLWFWCKFVVGLTTVLLVLDGTTSLLCWTAPRDKLTSGMSWAYVACMPIIHALMFSLAVLGTCVLRRPVIGGIFALVSYFALTAIVEAFPATMHLEPLHIYNEILKDERAGQFVIARSDYLTVYGAFTIAIVVNAVLAFRFSQSLQQNGDWLRMDIFASRHLVKTSNS